MSSEFAAKGRLALALLAAVLVASTVVYAGEPARHREAFVGHRSSAGPADERRSDDDWDRRGPVLPPHSIVAGKSIGAWTADHWTWMFSFLVGQSPVFDDPTGELGYLGDVGGPVFFIAAIDDVQRKFSVPCGKYLLYPLFTYSWALDPGDTEESARKIAKDVVDGTASLYARVDGKRVPNLFSHRETTPPGFFTINVPNGGLFGDEGGSFDTVADGYWLMLKPLSPGMHTLAFGAATQDGQVDYRVKLELRVTGNCRDR